MSGAAQTVLGLEADKQKTAAANAETERLLRLKAALTPRTGAGGAFSKAEPFSDVAARFTAELIKQGLDAEDAYTQGLSMANDLFANQGGGGAAPAAGGGAGNDPGIDLFLEKAAEANPNMTEEALRTEYARLYGGTA